MGGVVECCVVVGVKLETVMYTIVLGAPSSPHKPSAPKPRKEDGAETTDPEMFDKMKHMSMSVRGSSIAASIRNRDLLKTIGRACGRLAMLSIGRVLYTFMSASRSARNTIRPPLNF